MLKFCLISLTAQVARRRWAGLNLAFPHLVSSLFLILVMQIAPVESFPSSFWATSYTSQNSGQLIVEGQVVSREIEHSQPHTFRFEVGSSGMSGLMVHRHGVDLVVMVRAPDKSVRTYENPAGPESPINVSLMAPVSGTYIAEVRAKDRWAGEGSYEIGLAKVRTPEPADLKRIEAQWQFAEGRRLQFGGGTDEWHQALLSFDNALSLWRELGDKFEQANTLQAIGQTYGALEHLNRQTGAPVDLTKVKDYFQQAIDLRREIEQHALAYTLFDLAEVVYSLKGSQFSLPFYQTALEAFKQTDDPRGQARVLTQLGICNLNLYQVREARQFLQAALEIDRSEKDVYQEARVLNAIGGAFDREAQPDLALTHYQQAFDRFQQMNDPLRAANVLINIGLVYDTLGEWSSAFDSYKKCEELFASVEDPTTEDRTYRQQKRASLFLNWGGLHASLGNFVEGFDYLQRSLELRPPSERGHTLMWLGYAHALADEPQKALEYGRQALEIQEPAKAPGRAQTYTVMGMAEDALGDHAAAVRHFDQALQIQQTKDADLNGAAITLDKRGVAYTALGEAAEARADFDAALRLWRAFKDRNGEAMTLFHLAELERNGNNFAAARDRVQAAINLIEPLRTSVLNQQLRSTYFASKVDYYGFYIDLLMHADGGGIKDRSAIAFEMSERARARGLLDILNEARIGFSDREIEQGSNSDPNLSRLVERKRAVQKQLDVDVISRTKLLVSGLMTYRVAEIDKEIAALTSEYYDLDAQIRSSNPKYAALVQPKPVTVKEVQQQLLDENTILLEFALGEERSYLWAVTPTTLASYELPKREEIETAARRVKEILASSRAGRDERAYPYQVRLARAQADLQIATTALSKMLLTPAASELGNKRLVIVADGELQYIPFGALPSPVPQAANHTGPNALFAVDPTVPLIQNHEVVSLPSASTLAMIRSETAGRQVAAKDVAVLADPVFEREDSRITRPERARTGVKPAPAIPSALTRALEDFDEFNSQLRLYRLQSSGDEARNIMALVPEGRGFKAVDFAANRATATSPVLGQYRYIHFATHGLLNDTHPELSGLVFSLFDEKGRPQEDGFMRLHDVYNLKLPAEMVVLSACQTGLGKKVKGEGLIGLTRGFMYAGAARVVASLWKVEDRATAELMKRFYKALFKDKMSPAAALRAAQNSLRQESKWKNPYFWSGFILQGEYR